MFANFFGRRPSLRARTTKSAVNSARGVSCPPDTSDCEGQKALSSDDGCGEELTNWFAKLKRAAIAGTMQPSAGPGKPRRSPTMATRLTPFGSHDDRVYPRAESQAADKSEHILEMGDTANPPHVPQEHRDALCGIVIEVMLEGKFVKDWKHQNSQYR
jgi:hypothetical protein